VHRQHHCQPCTSNGPQTGPALSYRPGHTVTCCYFSLCAQVWPHCRLATITISYLHVCKHIFSTSGSTALVLYRSCFGKAVTGVCAQHQRQPPPGTDHKQGPNLVLQTAHIAMEFVHATIFVVSAFQMCGCLFMSGKVMMKPVTYFSNSLTATCCIMLCYTHSRLDQPPAPSQVAACTLADLLGSYIIFKQLLPHTFTLCVSCSSKCS
jgi:hypothetical protein